MERKNRYMISIEEFRRLVSSSSEKVNAEQVAGIVVEYCKVPVEEVKEAEMKD